MEASVQMSDIAALMKRLEQKVDFIGAEVVEIKSYLDEDGILTPQEKRMVDSAVRRVKAGDISDAISLSDLRKKVGG
jgi:transcription antitermination factor NusA-like protein